MLSRILQPGNIPLVETAKLGLESLLSFSEKTVQCLWLTRGSESGQVQFCIQS